MLPHLEVHIKDKETSLLLLQAKCRPYSIIIDLANFCLTPTDSATIFFLPVSANFLYIKNCILNVCKRTYVKCLCGCGHWKIHLL